MKIMRTMMWCAVLTALTLAGTAQAWLPAGWVYVDWPWAYDRASGDWHWFSADGTQWIYAFPPGAGWARLPQSSIAQGWSYWDGAWAYDYEADAWCWRNTSDTHWVVNMRTGIWNWFGERQVPDGMVRISGGTNAGSDHDFGAYTLTVSSFYMDRHEVTRAQWNEVYFWALGNGYDFDYSGSGRATNHPVHTVNWYDVVKWCNARSEQESRPAVYTVGGSVYKTGQVDNVVQSDARGYRLPSSTEWEYAARGGAVNRRFPWEDTDTIQHARANYFSSNDDSYDTSPTHGYHPSYGTGDYPFTSLVGSFAPNGYGLYDMAGNVEEWCFDRAPDDEEACRLFRGGSWYYPARGCRVGDHDSGWADSAFSFVGFRAVLPPGQP